MQARVIQQEDFLAALSSCEAMLSLVLGSAAFGVMIVDRAGRTVRRVGKSLEAVPSPSDLERALGGATFDREIPVDGRTFLAHFQPLRDQASEVNGVAAILVEVSHWKGQVEELRSARDQLRTLLRSVADGIIASDPHGKLLFANDAAARQIGFCTPAELEATPVEELLARYEFRDLDGKPVASDRLPAARALETKALSEAVLQVRESRSGEERYVVLRSAPICDLEGRVEAVVSVWHDISQLERAKRELLLKDALLAATCEASPAAVLLLSPDRRLISYNKRLVHLWKLRRAAPGDTTGQAVVEAIRGSLFAPELLTGRFEALSSNRHQRSRDELRLKDGRLVEAYSAPVIGPKGAHYGRGWFFRDITTLRKAREREQLLSRQRQALSAAEDAEHRARFLSRASEVLAASLDLDAALTRLATLLVPYLGDWCIIDLVEPGGRVRRVAVSHSDPLKAPLASRLQQVFAECLVTSAAPPLQQSIVRRVELGEPLGGWPFLCGAEECVKLARQLGVASYLSAPMISRGAVLGAVTVVCSTPRCYQDADIRVAEELASRAALAAENARLYREAREAVRVREEFFSIASHELRTPIASVLLGLQAVLKVLRRSSLLETLPSPAPTALESAERQARRLGELVDQLLDVTRIHAGQLSLELRELDLAQVTRDVVHRLDELAASVGCEISLRAPEPVTGRWDVGRVDQIVTNLLSNALKFGAGKPIEVEVRAHPRAATLLVRDHGIGIQPDQRARLFEPFERGASHRYTGLGLGLYIVHRIVEALGGTVEVESELGRGATFKVQLPRAAPC